MQKDLERRLHEAKQSFALIKQPRKYRKLLPYVPLTVLILGFGLVGVILTVSSHAATVAKPMEAEAGQLGGNANTVADTTGKASGGSFVNFSSGGSNPNPTPPPPGGGGGNDGDPTAATCNSFTMVGPPPGLSYQPNQCEDFNDGLGGFDPYNGGGGDTVISDSDSRQPGQCSNGGGFLALKQDAAGHTCGGEYAGITQQYGYWEVRMRAYSTGTGSGSAPHPVLIIWDPGAVWENGEMDFFETDIGDPAGGYLHCLGHPVDNCYQIPDNPVDYSKWHVYGFDWRADSGSGYIDGVQWWTTSNNDWSIQDKGHLTIQLDNLQGSTPVKPGEMDVDWIHTYK
jgi:hypothetical protein